MNSANILCLPYDIMEIILRYLDGKSFLAISKVCQDLHYSCKTFFYYCKEDFWKDICYKELTTEQILGSCSGSVSAIRYVSYSYFSV